MHNACTAALQADGQPLLPQWVHFRVGVVELELLGVVRALCFIGYGRELREEYGRKVGNGSGYLTICQRPCRGNVWQAGEIINECVCMAVAELCV